MPGRTDPSRVLKNFPNSWYSPQITSIGVPSSASLLQGGLAREEVVLDDELSAVLSAAADDQVHVRRERVADVVLEQFRRVAVPAQALREDQGVAPVAVDVHVPRVELQDPDGSLAGGRGIFGRKFVPKGQLVRGFGGLGGHETTSTVVILDSSRRMASMAV